MKIYLAGPMSGLPDHNHPAFMDAAATLRGGGNFVFNPAEANPIDDSYRAAMAVDLAWISSYAEMVVLLPGFQKSKGCRIEVDLALALEIPIVLYEDALQHFADLAAAELARQTGMPEPASERLPPDEHALT